MVKFWKEHAALRMALMVLTFVAGMGLILFGWKQTGQLRGLGVMLLGLVLLLGTLWLYNIVFTDPRNKGK